MSDSNTVRSVLERKKVRVGQGELRLQADLKLEGENKILIKNVKWHRSFNVFLLILLVIGIVYLSLTAFTFNKNTIEMKDDFIKEKAIERGQLIISLFTITEAIKNDTPTRPERLEFYAKKAKAVILNWGDGSTDMSDEEIDRLVLKNFEYAEMYMVSPWEFLAYCAAESDFMKMAESPTGAKGIAQFLSSTMRLVLGDDYRPGIEFDPVWACKAWYKFWLVINDVMQGDRKWTVAYYQTGSLALRAKNKGMPLEEYMNWITSTKQLFNNPKHPWRVEEIFNKFVTYGYEGLR